MSLQKFKKRKHIAALIFAGAMALVPFAVSSCSVNCNPQTQTDKSDSSDVNNNSSSSGSSSTPDTNTSKDEHCKIVYNLLHDVYYVNLHNKIDANPTITKDMLPVPYKFLRDEGKNVDAYLDGTLNAFASSYMYENDKNHLYVSVKAENISNSSYGNYYTNYVLKYTLTDQESEEFLYLCDGEYLQGLLFVQELDIQKDPEVLSEVNIAKDTYELMLRSIPNGENINPDKYRQIEIDMTYASMDSLSFSIRNAALSNFSNTKIRILNVTNFSILVNPNRYDTNVYWYGRPTSGEISYDDYLSSTKNIISFGYSQRIMHSNPYYAFSIQK